MPDYEHRFSRTFRKLGNGNTSLLTEAQIKDTAGRSNVIGVFGEQWATDVKNDILAQFSYGKSTRDLKNETTVGSGTVTIEDDNLLTASTGTDTDGKAGIESYNSVRYRPGHTVLTHFTAIFTNPTADNTHQWIGVADGIDGFGVGFIDGEFAVMRMKAGVHTHIFKSGFNGTVDIDNIDFTKINIFRITFGYLGAAPAAFEILPPGQAAFEVIHTWFFHGEIAETHIRLPYLPIRMEIENTGNNTDCQIRSGSWHGGVMGLCQDCGNRGFAYPFAPGSALVKADIGTTPVVLAGFKSVTTFQGFANKIRAKLAQFGFTPYDASEDVLLTIQLVGGATVTGGTYVDVDSTNSTLQINSTATGYTGGGAGLTLYATGSAGQGNNPPQSTPADLDTEALGLFLDPGQEYAIIAFTDSGTINTAWSVNWVELF